ncbi:MAG: hypothetical protein AB1482_06535 [Pseudomonadota bacterium]
MSDAPFMRQMDALLKKHRGSADPAFDANGPAPRPADAPGDTDARNAAPPPAAWLPVLTDVIERGTPPAPAAATAAPPVPPTPPPPAPVAPAADPAPVTDTLAEQLMSELAPRLSEIMEKQVAAELRKNLDQTVSALLAQLDVNVREIVRQAIDEKLGRPRDPSA